MSSLNNAEKEALKNITLAMSQEEKSYCIRFYPTELLQIELSRRDEESSDILGRISGIMSQVMADKMTLNDKEIIINALNSEISRQN